MTRGAAAGSVRTDLRPENARVATFLYKLGRLAFRRRRIVALIWVALLVARRGRRGHRVRPRRDDDFSIPGTEAQKAFDLLEERFPEASADGATARIVFKAPTARR